MIQVLSRRLRVRDDGTGRGRETDATFAEFESEDAIVLLGDPGMGKTTFFREAATSNYTTVRRFLIEPNVPTGKALFLDALDEYRTISTGQDVSAEIARVICALKKPKFRVSCRAADWFGSSDQEVLRGASASGRVVVLELRPLTRDEILNAVEQIVPDPHLFLEEAESAGLGKLLNNPQTLELVARAWCTDKKPQNKFEAYEIGVSELLKETNVQHTTRGVNSPNSNDLRKAACAAASTLLLSNSVGISRTEPADGDGYVKLSVLPYPNRGDLDAVLKRRLFVSLEVDRFEPVHRTIAEFLAAEDLSNRIMNSLPIDRVMALICGVDGKPVSSLRGLFAWLMCKLKHLAEGYVERDPYGVATYGDASVLPPGAQCAIWAGLRKLRDPWFLANEDDRGSFRGLGNLNTATIIRDIIQDSTTGIHLKIAALEGIANSTDNIGLNAILRSLVLDKTHNEWIRSTALRAFAKSVQNDWAQLNVLDTELAKATDDLDVTGVRTGILHATRAHGSVPRRILSIMEQAASAKKNESVFGRFRRLRDLPSDTDLDEILDGASEVLMPKSEYRFEFQLIFDEWLKRRLDTSTPIMPAQLASWLRSIRVGRDHHPEKTLASLKARFDQEPTLFQKVFELLANFVPNQDRSFSLFLAVDLWKLLPATVWPVSQCEFFLASAEKDNNPERAADFFHMYLSWFPSTEASVALAESGFELLARRHDVARALGKWNICKIEKWREDQFKRREKKSRKRSAIRSQNVAYLTPRLTTIREGGEENALVWATQAYLGFSYDSGDVPDARERLVTRTNEAIAEALIEGIVRYVETPIIPKMEAVIASWRALQTPEPHIVLLTLSAFLRLTAGMSVPEEALPACIAAVVTNFSVGNSVPGWNATLSGWVQHQAGHTPSVVSSVLRQLWVTSAKIKHGILPGFYELEKDSGLQHFLASVSADVLKTGINEDHYTVGELVTVLLLHDRQAILEIGETELARNKLSAEVRVIWSTALFVIDPNKYLNPWKTLVSGSDPALWQVIEVLAHRTKSAVSLTLAQRTEIITTVGQRFANIAHPINSSDGSQNPWDAAAFVANQIKLLAADGSPDTDAQLERLESDVGLASYRDLIRHQRAQYQKQQRESSFAFASPEEVAEAIANRAPATPGDLLAYIVDHLNALSHELARTQKERYRAYWNQSGRKLVKPKHEEDCSGLLADDLENRIKSHNLIVAVEHHMVAEKECDLVVLQGTERLLPIEIKHHYNAELWTAWRTQLDRLYTRDAKAGGLGIYLVIWSGEATGRRMPKLPKGINRPTNPFELKHALESLIPEIDHHRLRVVVLDISAP